MKFIHEIQFINLTQEIAKNSKDPSRKIGAIAVSNDSRRLILSTGWNGFPRGIVDTHERLHNRNEKHKFVIHAEMNMIYNACYNGVSLVDSCVFVYGLPVCSRCALALIQVGVSQVICQVTEPILEPWISEWTMTKSMFNETNVMYQLWDKDYAELKEIL